MNENSIAIIVANGGGCFLAHFFLGKSERLKKLFYDASHLFLILLFGYLTFSIYKNILNP